MPASKKTCTIKYNNKVIDKGAIIKLKITRPTHTSLGGVNDLTTAAKKIIVKLVDNSNNNIKIFLHDVENKQKQALNIY